MDKGRYCLRSQYLPSATLVTTFPLAPLLCPPLQVLVDINWRPVFWPQGPDTARKAVMEYLSGANLIKISDADLEWLLNTDWPAAKKDPSAVCLGPIYLLASPG